MRLIDADALMEASKYEFWQDGSAITPIGEYILGKFRKLIRNMPTVTPEQDADMIHLQREQAYLAGFEDGRKQGWIPCSDAPDTDRNVFIARGERGGCMSVCIGHYSNEYKQWYEDRNWFGLILYDGLYWCEMPPLPEPYGGEGD